MNILAITCCNISYSRSILALYLNAHKCRRGGMLDLVLKYRTQSVTMPCVVVLADD